MVASYLKEECTLEAVIQLPPEYPLRNVEVTCSKRMGVSESRCVLCHVMRCGDGDGPLESPCRRPAPR